MNIEQIINNGDNLVPPDITDFYQSGKTVWCFWLHYDKKFEQVEDDIIVTVSWKLKYGNNDTAQTFSNHKKTYTIDEFVTAYNELEEFGKQDIIAFKTQCNKIDGVFLVTENSEGIQEIPSVLYGTENKSLVISATNVPVVYNSNLSTLLNFKDNEVADNNNDITFTGTPTTVSTSSVTGNSLLISNGEYFSINDQLLGGKNFTIDFFVCPNNACPNNSCICDIAHPNGDIKVNVLTKDNNLTLGFLLDNRTVAQTKDDITVTDTLVHVAIVYFSIKSFLYFFVNGNLVGNINITLTEKIIKIWFNRDITNNKSTFIGNLDQISIQNSIAVWIPNQPYQDYETQVVDEVGAVWQMRNGVVTVAPEGKGKFPGKTPGTTTGLWFNNVEDPEKYPDGICRLKYQNDVTYAELITPIKLGAADFTIDFWVYFNSIEHVKTGECNGAFEITMTDPDTQKQGILGCHYVYIINAGYRLCIHGTGVTAISNVRTRLNIQTLCHIALVFTQSDGKLSVFVGGEKKASVACISLQQKKYDFHLIVGRYYDNVGNSSDGPLDGAIDEFRISAGVARWTENFSPPTEPYTIDQYTKTLMRTTSFEQEEPEEFSFETVNPNKTFNPSTKPYVNKNPEQQALNPKTADFHIPIVEYVDDYVYTPIKQLPVQTAIPLCDGKTVFEPVWIGYDPQALKLEGDIKSSESGVHYVTFTPINNHVWWNGSIQSKTVPWIIMVKPLDYPKIEGDLTYNGTVQTVPISDFDEDGMILEGTTTATDANTLDKPYYIVTVKLKPGYSWTTGNMTPYELRWKIKPAIIDKPVLEETSSLTFIYDGTEKHPIFSYDNSMISAIGTTTATVPNMTNKTATLLTTPYEFIFSLKDKRNFRWSSTVDQDGGIENIVFSWYIKRKQITMFTVKNTEFIYNTKEQGPDITPTVWNSNEVTISNNKATGTGNYELVCKLTNTALYEWSDGSTANLTYDWSISPAQVEEPVAASLELVYNSTVQRPVFTYDDSLISMQGEIGKINPNYTNVTKTLLPGAKDYATIFSLKDKTNYVWKTTKNTANITKTWIIKRKIIPIFTVTNTDLTYNTKNQGPTLTPSTWNTNEVRVTGDSATAAGSYNLVCALTDTTSYEWSDGSTEDKTYSWSITTNAIQTPILNSPLEFVYNTQEQSPTFTYDSSMISVTGTLKATEPNVSNDKKTLLTSNYVITFKLKDSNNYSWSDDTKTDITYTWYIKRKTVTKFKFTNTSFTYNTKEQGPTLTPATWSTDEVTVTNNTKTDAGSYTLKCALVNTNRYEWSDGSTKDITQAWTINPVKVDIPVYTENLKDFKAVGTASYDQANRIIACTYDATNRTPTFTYDSTLVEKGGTATAKAANYTNVTEQLMSGSQQYFITFNLTDNKNYVWKTLNNTDEIKFELRIKRIAMTKIVISNTSFTYKMDANYNGIQQGVTLTPAAGNGSTDLHAWTTTRVNVTGNIATDVGTYTAKCTITDTSKYEWDDGKTDEVSKQWKIDPYLVTTFTFKNNAFTYNPNKDQGPTLTPSTWNDKIVTVTGNSAHNAGSYTVICKLNDTKNFRWSTGGTANLTYDWSISPAQVEEPVATSLELVYNRTSQSPTFTYDDTLISMHGDISRIIPNYTNVTKTLLPGQKDYATIFSLNDKINYVWKTTKNSANITKTWIIKRKIIPIFTVTNTDFTYNAKNQGPTLTPSTWDTNEVKVTGNSATTAGSYNLVCALTDTTSYEWSDGSTADITQAWTINKAAGSINLSGKYKGKAVTDTLRLVASEDEKQPTMTFTVTRIGTGKVTCTTNTNLTIAVAANYSTLTITGKKDTNEQPVTLTITAAEDDNYTKATVTLDVIVVIGLEIYSWTEIADMAADGTLLEYCKIGDYKTIPTPSKFTVNIGNTTSQLNNEEKSIKVILIGYNHNSTVEGNRVAYFMFGKLGAGRNLVLPNTTVPFFETTTNSNGWSNANIRSALTNDDNSFCYENLFPDELIGVMKPFVKWTDNIGGGTSKTSYVTPSVEYVSLLSEYEVFGTNTYGNSGESEHQKQYDYFKDSSVLQRYRNDNTETGGWALRTVNATDENKIVYVKPDGTVGTCDISECLDILFIFAVSKKQIDTIRIPTVETSIETLMHFDDSNDIFKDECNTQFTVKPIVKGESVLDPYITSSPAKFNKALYFTGNQYIKQLKGIMLGGKDFTVDFWIYVDERTVNLINERAYLFSLKSPTFKMHCSRTYQHTAGADPSAEKRIVTSFYRIYRGQKITYDKKLTDDDGTVYYKTVTETFWKQGWLRTLYKANMATEDEYCPLNKWMHIAIEYDHEMQQIFVFYNGIWVKQQSNAGYTENGQNNVMIHKHILMDLPLERYFLYLGWHPDASTVNGLIGAIDELRITNGVMRWPVPAEYYDVERNPNNEVVFTPPTKASAADDSYVLHDQVTDGYIVNLDQNNKVKTFNIEFYYGTINVISSHPNVATATIKNNVLTITGLSNGISKVILYTVDTNTTIGNTVNFTVVYKKT